MPAMALHTHHSAVKTDGTFSVQHLKLLKLGDPKLTFAGGQHNFDVTLS
jgi:hypothetical protein